MIDAIVLLTPKIQQSALTALLQSYDSRLTVVPAESSSDLDALGPDLLSRARLIAFTTATIVPRRLLDALGFGAYNFHPGPPTYPGWAPANFAVYDRAKRFGATAHAMVENVDAGPIVAVEWFDVPRNISVQKLDALTYIHLAWMFWRLAERLATQPGPLPVLPIQWSERKSTRRMYASMCDIPLDISKKELDRRVDAFSEDFRAIHPTITLHGVRFCMMKDQLPAVQDPAAGLPARSSHSSAPRPAAADVSSCP
jgi:methionyl-tRNA formyltransferase